MSRLRGAAQSLADEREVGVRAGTELSTWKVLTSGLGLGLSNLNPQLGVHDARLPQEERIKALFSFLSCD